LSCSGPDIGVLTNLYIGDSLPKQRQIFLISKMKNILLIFFLFSAFTMGTGQLETRVEEVVHYRRRARAAQQQEPPQGPPQPNATIFVPCSPGYVFNHRTNQCVPLFGK
ncbi:unnamed protein product, partial [Meganyctiphanes norvegica]